MAGKVSDVKGQSDEELVARLKELSKLSPLKGSDLEELKELVRELRRRGYTNRDISQLTRGRYKEPTVKQYTRGVRVEDVSTRDRAVKLFGEMVDQNLSLGGVEEALTVKNLCAKAGLNLSEAVSLMNALAQSKTDMKRLLELLAQLLSSGLSTGDLPTVFAFTKQMKSERLETKELQLLLNCKAKYGSLRNAIAALDVWRSLEEARAAVNVQLKKKEEAERKAQASEALFKQLEERGAKAQQAIDKYEKLQRMGYTDEVLSTIIHLASQLGRKPETVIEDVARPSRCKELKRQEQELNRRIQDKETRIRSLDIKYAHRLRPISMCNELLYNYGLSEEAISDIHTAVKRHGDSLRVFQELEKYDKSKSLDIQITEKGSELEARQKAVNKVKGEFEAYVRLVGEQLQKLPEQIKKAHDEATKISSELLLQHVRDMVAEAQKYAKTISEAAVLQKELAVARLIIGIRADPSFAAKVKTNDVAGLVDVLMAFSNAKGIQGYPMGRMRFGATEKIQRTYPNSIGYFPDISIADMLDWFKEAFQSVSELDGSGEQ